MDRNIVVLGKAADQKTDAAAKREALSLYLLKLVLDFVESRYFQLPVGAGREIQDRNDNLALAVLEAGKARAQFQITWWVETDPQTGRKDRLGKRGCTTCQSSAGGEQVNEKPTEQCQATFQSVGLKACLPGFACGGNGPLTIDLAVSRRLAIS